MNKNRDYLPAPCGDISERMQGTEDISEGLSSRVEANRRSPPYRTFIDKDGTEDRERRLRDLFPMIY